jgi:L-threonylcarbamoyladenylate synthase
MDIVKSIQKDGVGIFPTDTLYGILGSAFSKKAVERIYCIKGRDENKPFIILIASISDLKKFGVTLSKKQKDFLLTAWPGKVSVILPCLEKKFEYLHRGTKSLAFRLPKNKKLIDLLKKTGPLVAPSANPQNKKPASTIAEAKKYFADSVDFYVSGSTKKGKPSRVVSLLLDIPTVLRN